MPYKGKYTGCGYHDFPDNYKIGHRVNVPTDDSDQLLAAITKIPVSVGIGANEIKLYKNGVYNNWDCGSMNHAVLAVGFGLDNATGLMYWKVKNTWGTQWGEDGYIRMERKTGWGQGICQITQIGSYAAN